MFNIMDLASKYLDIDKLTAGMSRNYSKSESSEESYVVKKSRRKMKKKPKTKKKKIIIIKKKLQIPEPPKIIIVPQRVRRIKTSKSSVAKISSTSTKGNKKPIKTNSEKIKKKDLESKSSLPGQKGDNKKSPKKTSSVQKALKEFTKRKSQFLESLKLLQEHLSSAKAEDFIKKKDKEKPKTKKEQKSASESDVKIAKKSKPKQVQNEKIQKTVPFQEISEIKAPERGDAIESVSLLPYQVCQIGFLENKPQNVQTIKEIGDFNVEKMKFNVDEMKFDVDKVKFSKIDPIKKEKGGNLDEIVKSMKGMLPKCTVYRGRQ